MIEQCAGSVIGAELAASVQRTPSSRQAVDRRRVREAEAVAAEPVGPQRVDGDDEHVRARRARSHAESRRQDERSGGERRRRTRRLVARPARAQEAFAVPVFPCVAL